MSEILDDGLWLKTEYTTLYRVSQILRQEETSRILGDNAIRFKQGKRPASQRIKANIHVHIDANPDIEQLSVDQVLAQLHAANVKAGRTTVAERLQVRKGAHE